MCERGVHATGLADLLDHGKTARCPIYQHFPGGKSDLMEQATYAAGRTISALLDEPLATRTPADAVAGIIDYWKQGPTEKITTTLVGHGADPTRAAQLASLVVSSVEGAIAQTRSAKSTRPLDDVRAVLIRLVGNAVSAQHQWTSS